MVVLLRIIVQGLLLLRYRIRVRGLAQIARRGTRGILFLPNHPALVDPVIMMMVLHRRFRPQALADRDQTSIPLLGPIIRQFGIVQIPDVKVYGAAVRAEVDAARERCIANLRNGGNLLVYPSGHIYRTRREDLRGNSAVEDLLKAAPDARVVLVRTRGLWGSAMSMAAGEVPSLTTGALRSLGNALASYLFFMPKREVTIEFFEPTDLPRGQGREALNRYIEQWYNHDAPPPTYVAYRLGERPAVRVLPDPVWEGTSGDLSQVPEQTRRLVLEHVREVAGLAEVKPTDRLAQDLGLDSLVRAELLAWVASEFGVAQPEGDAIRTVGDLMLAARGEAVSTRPTKVVPPPKEWFDDARVQRLVVPEGRTIAEVFLATARREPQRLVVADQRSGGKTYRELITAIYALRGKIAALPGDCVGIMLPASVGAIVAYLATVFAGKTPVMINWTVGLRSIRHILEITGTQRVLTAQVLVGRLKGQGVDVDALADVLLPLEDVSRELSKLDKLAALLRSYVSWGGLLHAQVSPTAVVLMTSGSESLPKAVPLTHENILSNLRDTLAAVEIRTDDKLLGFLPPFHSFGLTVATLLPLLTGARGVYHANPTEAFVLTRLIAAYRTTVVLGTPTFLSGILRAAGDPRHLKPLRLAVTGAEKCPDRTYALFAERCPQATVLEGYGITECSPIVSANRMELNRAGTIGQVLPSVEYAIVNPETHAAVGENVKGLLLVRGPSIFPGYIGDDVPSPFVEYDGAQWYNTGDLVSVDGEGVLTFQGRLKRFVKIGGEMVSLPAIEAALLPTYQRDEDDGPVLAVSASADEHRPELVLFATRSIARGDANKLIREAGLSPLHNISRVIELDELPVLGTGKTDYRALRTRLQEESA